MHPILAVHASGVSGLAPVCRPPRRLRRSCCCPGFLAAMASRVVLGSTQREEKLVGELPVELTSRRSVESRVNAKFQPVRPSKCQRNYVLGAGFLLGDVLIGIRTVDQLRPSSSPSTDAIVGGFRSSRTFSDSGWAGTSTFPRLRALARAEVLASAIRAWTSAAAPVDGTHRDSPRVRLGQRVTKSRRFGEIEQRAAQRVREPRRDVPVIGDYVGKCRSPP